MQLGTTPNRHSNNGKTSITKKPATSKSKAPKTRPEELDQYLSSSYQLIPLHQWNFVDRYKRERGKSPTDSDWRNKNYRGFDAKRHMDTGKNIGVRLTSEDLVVDADPRNYEGKINSLAKLKADLGLDLEDYPYVSTGSEGFHFYMRKPADWPVVETLAAYPGIEFKTAGRQVVAAGSIHPNGNNYVWGTFCQKTLGEVSMAPTALLELIKRPEITSEDESSGNHTPEQLASMLAGLDPCDYRDQTKWLELMMSCHHATAGEGSEEFAEWSTSDPLYADHRAEILRRWDSLHCEGTDKITVKTLYKALHERKKGDLIPPSNTAQEAFSGEELPEIALEHTPETLQSLAVNYVWISTALAFIRRSDGKKFSDKQWESLYAHLWHEKGSIVNAAWEGKLSMLKFENIVYIPDAIELPHGKNGKIYNIYRSSGVDAKEGDVSLFVEHMEYMFPDEYERNLILDYFAHLVQKPAEKAHFALLIHGGQGTGKSALGELMQRIIGPENAVKPNNAEVGGRFSDWQEGAQLAIIEELMMPGRIEVANRLKLVITDPLLRIEAKFHPAYSIPNYLNLLCFTNHIDAVHIENGDRRWLVISSPVKAKGGGYYDRLFDFIKSDAGPAAVKHYLLNREIELNIKGRAPATKAKEDMYAFSMSDVDQYLLERFDQGSAPFDFDIIRVEDIVSYLAERRQWGEFHFTGNVQRAVRKFLQTRIGAVQLGRNTNSDLPKYRLWTIRNHEAWEEMGATARIEAYMRSRKAYENRLREEYERTEPLA